MISPTVLPSRPTFSTSLLLTASHGPYDAMAARWSATGRAKEGNLQIQNSTGHTPNPFHLNLNITRRIGGYPLNAGSISISTPLSF